MDNTTDEKITHKRGRKPSNRPLEERLKEYGRTQQERNSDQRKRSKEIKKNGDITQQNLYFLSHIIKSQGLSLEEVSNRCGLTQQAISWILIKDDTKLQNVKLILRSLGMDLVPEFAPKEESASKKIDIKNNNYEVIGEIPSVKNKIALDPILNDYLTSKKNLTFLAKFLTENRIRLSQLAEKLELRLLSVKNWFVNDDIHVSKLYKIAEAYGQKIIWRLKALQNDEN